MQGLQVGLCMSAGQGLQLRFELRGAEGCWLPKQAAAGTCEAGLWEALKQHSSSLLVLQNTFSKYRLACKKEGIGHLSQEWE